MWLPNNIGLGFSLKKKKDYTNKKAMYHLAVFYRHWKTCIRYYTVSKINKKLQVYFFCKSASNDQNQQWNMNGWGKFAFHKYTWLYKIITANTITITKPTLSQYHVYNGPWKCYQYTWIEHILLYETYTKGSVTSSFNLVLLFTYSLYL